MNANHHIAQANWARRLAPLDDPVMQSFVEQLDAINQLAEQSPGFVWRLQTESGDATEIVVFGDDELVLNMSVWESVETLKAYAYKSAHAQLLRDRGKWFHTPQRASSVLWWVPVGTEPTVKDVEERFHHLWKHGPSAEAFSFRELFPARVSART